MDRILFPLLSCHLVRCFDVIGAPRILNEYVEKLWGMKKVAIFIVMEKGEN